jgi:hypothetical protein
VVANRAGPSARLQHLEYVSLSPQRYRARDDMAGVISPQKTIG